MTAALTILRGYVVAGRPEMAIKPFGRFEQWSATVRAALVWLGEPDPLTTRERIVADDPLRAELQSVLTAWRAALGDDKITAAALLKRIADRTDDATKTLKDAIYAAVPDITTRKLGTWLRHREGRILDNLRIERAGTHQGVIHWRCADAANS